MTVPLRIWLLSLWLLALTASLTTIPLASAASEFDSLYAGIKLANRNGSGAIALSDDVVLTAPLPPIRGSLTIDGSGHSISGARKHRIFDVNGGRLGLNNVTLTEGLAPYDEDGGAILMRNGAEVVAQNAVFTENSAKWGGAIMMLGANARLIARGSSFVRNRAREYAGAIYAVGDVTIGGSSFIENSSSDFGGALVASKVELQIFNSTFHGNRASFDGGTVLVFGGDVTLTHLTLTQNRLTYGVSFPGGTREKHAIKVMAGTVRLRNSIVDGDSVSGDCGGGLDHYVGNLSTDGTCSLKPGADPLLENLTGTPAYRPLKDRSPAVDAADPAYCLANDQVGTARPQGGGCDIGAFESTTVRPPEKSAVPPPPCPLADKIIAANTDAPFGGCRAGSGHDTIVLDADIELSAPLPVITSEITIEGRGYAISGSRSFRIFDIDRGKLTVRDLTLTNGAGSGKGGAIRLQNNSQAFVNNSRFISNIASYGGAIGMMSSNYVSISNSTFVRNRAAYRGGAISMNGGGAVEIRSSSFVENHSSSDGGAIGTYSGRVSASNSSFMDNSADNGGAVFAGGASSSGAVAVTLTHVTMLNNMASQGLGIYIDAGRTTRVALRLRNSVIAGLNRRGTALCSGRLAQNVRNLIEDASCAPELEGEPGLAAATDSSTVVAPLADSPLIDVALPEFCSETDQIGQRRPRGRGCDIGALEFVPPIRALSECRVTTTHGLNFRDEPFGNRIGSVPVNTMLAARARTPVWFQVKHEGKTGWISADYVATRGQCG